MKNKSDWKIKNGKSVSYAEDFRIRIVKEVEAGIISKEAARRKYGISGKATV